MQGISLFTSAYSFARQRGLLDTRVGRSLFIAAYFQYKKRLEDPFAGLAKRHPSLFKGGHIVDAGANIGYCSALFSNLADPGRSVFAFEPEPFNIDLLRQVIRTRTKGIVVPVQAALGSAEGEIRLQLNPHHHGDHKIATAGAQQDAGCITVPLTTIDIYLERHHAITPVCLVKIDVQGYEFEVCRGAEQTLARNPECTIVLEFTPDSMEAMGFVPADLLAWFEKRGYHLHTLDHDGSVKAGLPAQIGARGYVDLLFRRSPLV